MIEKIIEYSARNRVIVLMFFALVAGRPAEAPSEGDLPGTQRCGL